MGATRMHTLSLLAVKPITGSNWREKIVGASSSSAFCYQRYTRSEEKEGRKRDNILTETRDKVSFGSNKAPNFNIMSISETLRKTWKQKKCGIIGIALFRVHVIHVWARKEIEHIVRAAALCSSPPGFLLSASSVFFLFCFLPFFYLHLILFPVRRSSRALLPITTFSPHTHTVMTRWIRRPKERERERERERG